MRVPVLDGRRAADDTAVDDEHDDVIVGGQQRQDDVGDSVERGHSALQRRRLRGDVRFVRAGGGAKAFQGERGLRSAAWWRAPEVSVKLKKMLKFVFSLLVKFV